MRLLLSFGEGHSMNTTAVWSVGPFSFNWFSLAHSPQKQVGFQYEWNDKREFSRIKDLPQQQPIPHEYLDGSTNKVVVLMELARAA